MEKLELKHLAPYLPYELKFYNKTKKGKLYDLHSLSYSDMGVCLFCNEEMYFSIKFSNNNYKPILKPLINITDNKYLEDLGRNFYCDAVFEDNSLGLVFNDGVIAINVLSEPLESIEFLCKNHFDIFGLIEKGLAVDINTLENI